MKIVVDFPEVTSNARFKFRLDPAVLTEAHLDFLRCNFLKSGHDHFYISLESAFHTVHLNLLIFFFWGGGGEVEETNIIFIPGFLDFVKTLSSENARQWTMSRNQVILIVIFHYQILQNYLQIAKLFFSNGT
jgi:hypothetical protein